MNEKTEFVGGWLGEKLDKAGEFIIDGLFDLIISILGLVGNIALYISIVIIAFGFYCMIFQYRKPLKIGFIVFLISMILIVIGGIGV